MTLVAGSLAAEMKTRAAQKEKLAVLVIDESGTDESLRRAGQKTVLDQAVALGIPIYMIEIGKEPPEGADPGGGDKKYVWQQSPMMAALSTYEGFRFVLKPFLNAFDNPRLLESLREAQIATLVVMGKMTDQCVRLTCVGGKDKPTAGEKAGALQLGFGVLTSRAILYPETGGGSWLAQTDVQCFDKA